MRGGAGRGGDFQAPAPLLTCRALAVFVSLQAPWLRSGPGRCEALAARACLVAVNPARGPGPRGARSGKIFHNLMERKDFETWLDNISVTFLSLTDLQKNETLDHLISLSGAVQLRHLSNNLETLLKRDFLKLLPLELSFYLLKWLDPQTLLTCCLVSKQWNKVISACTEVWQTACKNLGWQIDDSVQDALHWKKVYLKAILRMKQLEDHEAFETSSLIGHSARVYALYYKDGLLCTGSDDLSAKLWDVSTGQCVYGIQTHTCAAVKFDEQKLVTGSFDNTVACWEWSSGARTQHFRGHTGAALALKILWCDGGS
uniref:F-box and WD repeat domain containing 2 n=1 Tax=Macaca mulatta TaxID=9544 RepID=A0A5F7ZBI6_MACMU